MKEWGEREFIAFIMTISFLEPRKNRKMEETFVFEGIQKNYMTYGIIIVISSLTYFTEGGLHVIGPNFGKFLFLIVLTFIDCLSSLNLGVLFKMSSVSHSMSQVNLFKPKMATFIFKTPRHIRDKCNKQ